MSDTLTQQRTETDSRVRHPLQTVRGTIRSYVLLEGLGITILYLAMWFWIGMALDWGAFQIFAFDWIQELQYATVNQQGGAFALRAVLLGLVVAGLIALLVTRVFVRLFREFSDAAVALVLERRFPKELGDRLITAVELADPKLSKQYGFSPGLVEKTINDGADRVEKLPVSDVFDWVRLRRLFYLDALATLGIYILVGVVTCVVGGLIGGSSSPFDFVWRFHDVASIWVERNVLLQNSYWPRQAHLEVIRFQDTADHPGEMRVGRDEARPDLGVRAVKYVVADRSVPGGWRALKVSDLDKLIDASEVESIAIPRDWEWWQIDLDDVSTSVPGGILPGSLQNKTSGQVRQELESPKLKELIASVKGEQALADLLDWKTWTVDRLELQLDKQSVRAALREQHQDAVAALERVLARVGELANSASMSRRVRQLAIPEQVTVYSRGKTTKDEMSRELLPDNKYAIGLNELKESSRFTVRGKDYYTPSLDITLVPPPALRSLAADKEEPAYLYHRLQGDQSPLKGKRQQFKNASISVTGDMSIIQAPIGTSLMLKAELEENRKLRDGVRIVAPDKFTEAGSLVPEGKVEVAEDGRHFQLAIPAVTRNIEFVFDFHDQDKVKGKRRVLIRPIDDRAPEVLDVDLEVVLRKPRFKVDASKVSPGALPDGFLITPDAFLPIKGTVRDDFGLSKVDWIYDVEPIAFELVGQFQPTKVKKAVGLTGNAKVRRAALVVSGLTTLPGQPGMDLIAPVYWNWVGRMMLFDLAAGGNEGESAIPIDGFARLLAEKSFEEIPATALADLLTKEAKPRTSLKQISWKDKDGFDVKRYLPKLKSPDPTKQAQLHYQLRLALSATDNNIETGPNTTRNKSPFNFLVVSESELLTQIALEEEVLSERLEKAYDKLDKGRTTLDEQIGKLSDKAVNLEPISIRIDEVRKAVLEANQISREVHGDYSRIQKELEINRCGLESILKVANQIVSPLDRLLDPKDGEFVKTEEQMGRVFDTLEQDVLAKATSGVGRIALVKASRDQVDDLMGKLNDVLKNIQQVITSAKVLEITLRLEQEQRRIAERLDELHKQRIADLLNDLLNPTKK